MKHDSMTNLRLPPPRALPSTARGPCSFAKPTGRRGRRCRCCSRCFTSAPPLHTPPQHFAPFPAWRDCTPVTPILHECSAAPCLSTPQRSTRGVAPRNNAARVAKATMNLFHKTNEMQKQSACGGAAIFNGIARRVTRVEHSAARASSIQSLQGGKAFLAFASPCFAARRHHRMASALSCATPSPR